MVHEYGTVTAAAEVLHLTPSAVSHQLRQLARELDATLLEREGRGVRLTPAGHRLVAHADTLQAAWEQARADLAALETGEVGRVRLAAFTSGIIEVLVPVLDHLAEVAPRLEVELHELERTTHGLDRLLANEIDVALVVATTDGPRLDDPRFEQDALLSDPLDLVVALDHPLARHEPVDLADTAHEPWVLPGRAAWDCYELVVSACASAGFSPTVAHRANSTAAIGALVGAGRGVTLLPRLAALGTEDAVVRVPLVGDPPPRRRVLTCVRRGSAAQPAVAQALAALHAVTADLPVRAPGGAVPAGGGARP
ncbi:LysR family transcriptional regulator [Nitriliruptoraceae bacterium ZYF776]|nr:LysR family transcriptional regulator [Profundirhabdus halotolerans]